MGKYYLHWKAAPSGKTGNGPAIYDTKREATSEARRMMRKYPHLTIKAVKLGKKRRYR